MEIILIALVVILIFGGAKKIPEISRSLGRARGEFERGKMEVEKEMAADRAKPPAASAAAAGPPWTCAKCGAESPADAGTCQKCGSAKPLPA